MKIGILVLLLSSFGCVHVRHARIPGSVHFFGSDCERPCERLGLLAAVVDGTCICEGEK